MSITFVAGVGTSENANEGLAMQSQHYWSQTCVTSRVHALLHALLTYLLAMAPVNTLETGYGDFRTSVAKRRRWATEISVFPYGWMEDGFGFVMC